MTSLFSNVKLLNILKIPVRYKNPPHHWSELKKKRPSTKKALEHFDDFYDSVYGESWKPIRAALLSEDHKYVAIINNFSNTDRIREELESQGAMDMKLIYEAAKKNMELQKEKQKKENLLAKIENLDKKLDQIVAEKQYESSVYPNPFDDFSKSSDNTKNKNDSFKPVKLQSIEKDVNIVNDDNRLIKPAAGITASQLYEYVPATKIKGMDDFILESEHYNYYSQGADFSIRIEDEYNLNFPEKLGIYTFEEANFTRFRRAKTGETQVLDYFVLDGASVLPILSLDLQPGDRFLDMCGAPGGKSMIALQTLNPHVIVCNDIQQSRINRINKFLNEFLPGIGDWDKRFFITQSDARFIEDTDVYNKILADVPCTTDRHVLHEDDNNIFKGTRLKERLRLPEMQSAILTNALRLVVPGGTVVYSTCSLSPIQNEGVVQIALKKAFEEHNRVFIVKDQSPALTPLKYLYNFGNYGLKYGHIVVPSKSRNWGPMYFCKMVRVQ